MIGEKFVLKGIMKFAMAFDALIVSGLAVAFVNWLDVRLPDGGTIVLIFKLLTLVVALGFSILKAWKLWKEITSDKVITDEEWERFKKELNLSEQQAEAILKIILKLSKKN